MAKSENRRSTAKIFDAPNRINEIQIDCNQLRVIHVLLRRVIDKVRNKQGVNALLFRFASRWDTGAADYLSDPSKIGRVF